MSEAQHDEEQPQEQPPIPLMHSLGYGAGTFLVAGMVDLLAHFGPTGLVVGGIIAYAAARHGPELASRVRENLPSPALPQAARQSRKATREQRDRASTGKSTRSLLDRALGRFPEEEADTMLVAEEEEEDLPLPDTLELGDLHPHADTAFSHRMAILGMPGAGKSNLIAVLVEELGQFDAPLIVLDHKPEYEPLCQRPYLSNPERMNARTLSPQNAAATAQRIMEERLQVVVDLSSYANDAQAALVMTELIAGVLRYQKARTNAECLPCTFVLEEAHYWLPENEGHSTIRGVKLRSSGQSLLAYVQQAFFTLAKLGRSFGMGLIVATQRPADVDKRLISSADWRFLLRALEPADLKVYRSYGLTDEQAMALNPKRGEAYVIGPDGLHCVYHIRRRYSPDVAKSPGLANIRNAGPVATHSPVPGSPEGGAFERGKGWEDGKMGMDGNEPGTAPQAAPTFREYPPMAVKEREYSQAGGKGETGYTHEEEMQVLRTALDLTRENGKVTRGAIQERLRWSNRDFSRVIKPVCDKHGIALRD